MLNFVAAPFAARPRAISLRSALPLVASDSKRCWIQMARIGSWKGHPSGEFQFTNDVFKKIIKNFDDDPNPAVIYYEHPQHNGDGKPLLAAGWLHKLRVNGEWLEGFAEWTDDTAEYIRKGQYKFSSVVVDFEGIDAVSNEAIGPVLFEHGLTNVPFIRGQKPITFSRRVSAERSHMSETELIKAALEELGDKATTASVSQWVEGRKMQLAAIDGKQEDKVAEAADEPAEAVAASAEAPADTTVELADDMPAEAAEAEEAGESPEAEAAAAKALIDMIAEAAGLDAAAVISGLEEGLDSIVGMLSGAPSDGTEAETEAARSVAAARGVKVGELQARIAELEERETVRTIDAAIACGDVLGKDREKLVKLAKDAPHLLDEFVKPAKSAIPTTSVYSASKPGPKVAPADDVVIDLESLTDSQLHSFHVNRNAGLTKAKSFQLARQFGAESAN